MENRNNNTITENWNLIDINPETLNTVSKQLNLNKLLTKILLSKNVGDGNIEKIKAYLNPDLTKNKHCGQITSPKHLETA